MSAILQLLAASVLWSLSFGLIKGHLGHLHPAFVGFVRLALTLPVFVPLFRPQGLDRALVGRLLVIGGVQYGLAYSAYLFAYQYLQGHQVALLTIFTPIYVVLIDAASRRTRPRLAIAFALLAVAGAAIIQYRGTSWSGVAIGVGLLQIANVCFAAGQLAYRSLRRRHPQLSDRRVFALPYVGAVLVTAITTTVLGGWQSAALLDAHTLGVLLYLGVGASGVGFFLWNRGAVQTAPATLAVLNNVKIPLAVVASVVVFEEPTDPLRLSLGAGVMVVSAILAQRFAGESPSSTET